MVTASLYLPLVKLDSMYFISPVHFISFIYLLNSTTQMIKKGNDKRFWTVLFQYLWQTLVGIPHLHASQTF